MFQDQIRFNVYIHCTQRLPAASTISTSERPQPFELITIYAARQTSGKIGGFNFQVTPRLVMDPNAGTSGSTVVVQGLGFGAGERVKGYWNNPRQFLGTATANSRGSLTDGSGLTITIPAGAPGGANAVIGVEQSTRATIVFVGIVIKGRA